MSEILEVVMIVSFGMSWPMNVIKSWRARTTKGKSLAFLCFIFFGYIAGITSKLINEAYMAALLRRLQPQSSASMAVQPTRNPVPTHIPERNMPTCTIRNSSIRSAPLRSTPWNIQTVYGSCSSSWTTDAYISPRSGTPMAFLMPLWCSPTSGHLWV